MAIANFIPQIWSARLLEHLDKSHVFAALCNRDYEGEISKFGDTVYINQIGDITVKDYDGIVDSPEELDSEQLTLTIDQKKYFNFAIDDVDNAQSNPKLMNAAMERAAYAMNDVTDSFIAGLMAANAETIISATPTAETAYEYLVDLSTALTENNVPLNGRWAVVPAWYHGLLLKDDRFVSSGADFTEAIISGGYVGAAAGCGIYISNNCPVSESVYSVIAGTTAATSYAEQILSVEAFRPESSFADAVKGLHVYGSKVVQPKALAVLTATRA